MGYAKQNNDSGCFLFLLAKPFLCELIDSGCCVHAGDSTWVATWWGAPVIDGKIFLLSSVCSLVLF